MSWLTFCVLYTVAFSNFSWSILLCLFFTYFPKFNFSSLFESSRAFPEVSVSSQLHRDAKAGRPKWPRGQNFGLGLELRGSGLGLGLGLKHLASTWPQPLCSTSQFPLVFLGLWLTDWWLHLRTHLGLPTFRKWNSGRGSKGAEIETAYMGWGAD